MTPWIPLSRRHHDQHRFLTHKGYDFTEGQMTVPVVMAELGRLMSNYVLGFVRQGQHYQAVALLGLDGENNLYLHANGHWLGSYIPAELRGQPFDLIRQDDRRKVLCIDEGCLVEGFEGARLFRADGEESNEVKQTIDFLQQREKGRQQTAHAVGVLAKHGLIEPWTIEPDAGDRQSMIDPEGVFRVNERRFNKLSAESLMELRNANALTLAYAQLFSMFQLEQLKMRAEHCLQAGGRKHNNTSTLFEYGGEEWVFDFDR